MRNLKTELLQIEEAVLLACEHRGRFLWVVSMGATAAEDKEEREWFVRAFRRVVDGMDLRSWADVRRVLEGALWMEGLDGLGKRLWWSGRGYDY
jgi:hypothetical protein